ncbi:Fic family protein [Xanthomonas translucens]|uniref:Fic family protein n=1 Tax=Xanthomonas campestris pv. translucens TaxID=343 RepID=UPI0009BD1CF1|nr:Fic family protein [Xanthomonas translucens]QEO26750.1 Fic family protein [Xanthomonas translucens pv. undulosa]UPU47449.1 Fic family protein [Xanthomonas translucens pv. undulosa]WLA07083.1 Fic family protein [Xanthomonas translucens]
MKAEFLPNFFFIPGQGKTEPTTSETWSRADILKFTPNAIGYLRYSNPPRRCYEVSKVSLQDGCMLTSRLNLCSSRLTGNYVLGDAQAVNCNKCLKQLAPSEINDPLDWCITRAKLLGISSAALRPDLSWIGGKNPSEASLVLPDNKTALPLLVDLFSFIRGNSGAQSEEYPEYVAYQLLKIHPLNDGNGRVTRSLLIQMVLSTASIYPLYLAWCLLYDKDGTLAAWENAKARIVAMPDSSHYAAWEKSFIKILKVLEQVRGAIDHRAFTAFLLTGRVTVESFKRLNPQCGKNLVDKIVVNASDYLAEMKGRSQPFSDTLNACIYEFASSETARGINSGTGAIPSTRKNYV